MCARRGRRKDINNGCVEVGKCTKTSHDARSDLTSRHILRKLSNVCEVIAGEAAQAVRRNCPVNVFASALGESSGLVA